MRVILKCFIPPIRQVLGSPRIEITLPREASVKDLINFLKEKIGVSPLNRRTRVFILLNGKNIENYSKGFGTILNDGDEVMFLPLLSGG